MARFRRQRSPRRSGNTGSMRKGARPGRCDNDKNEENALAAIEVKVPDIGDFKDVPVIEILVKPGDVVKKEDSLVTLESDKATMEVPSTHAGTVKEVRVKVGDKVAQGTLIAVLDVVPAPDKDARGQAPSETQAS